MADETGAAAAEAIHATGCAVAAGPAAAAQALRRQVAHHAGTRAQAGVPRSSALLVAAKSSGVSSLDSAALQVPCNALKLMAGVHR